MNPTTPARLTQYAHGGGCACKIPPNELETMVAGLIGKTDPALVVGLDHGDDAAAVLIDPSSPTVAISTADFFTPVVDDPYDWGRIAAANALSDIYAMGGTPILAINLLGWPRDILPTDIATEVLRGGLEVCNRAGTPLAGGHSIDNPEPVYGLAVTGIGNSEQLLRNDAAEAGLPISITKPLGVGILNNRHKTTGELFPHAIDAMVQLNDAASRDALTAGITAATDITGFGLLGHLHKMARASGVSARIDPGAVPYLEGARQSLADGFIPGGSRRNLDWVRPHLCTDLPEEELLMLADAQTSGGLLLAGEIPGATVIGEFVPRTGNTISTS
ncbi:selenide, water dikinase SelD [Dermatophilus congolensis]|uniref:Selenide, water dikinase n=1 Tax=Dermatophilus congolensis TaxID=1863 RepID=A0A239V559_9MICO|nr:selenide, water dikinase SelD [Dermatophilus congolensis]MBO3130242.1 selenide, water dikinase SelD [Dermatophilus congolensis]MBO3131129.1 selenide, water dikinase SelD [Dermatophilus congolensis]MBO3134713.1 selenide, water dikinase SelD [Dermatophilus congolensis]MBO3136948.1 selenide, water dikinase SelD [Dermatophilus congolensis]MBO3139194.1 selenide, water dikinase SelD [Dermatophilus congolensis]